MGSTVHKYEFPDEVESLLNGFKDDLGINGCEVLGHAIVVLRKVVDELKKNHPILIRTGWKNFVQINFVDLEELLEKKRQEAQNPPRP